MAHSITLTPDIMKMVCAEAELQGRSVANQVKHWMHIGRAIEHSGNCNYARVVAALSGDVETTELTDREEDVWLVSFVEQLAQPGPNEDAFFARRRQLASGWASTPQAISAEKMTRPDTRHGKRGMPWPSKLTKIRSELGRAHRRKPPT